MTTRVHGHVELIAHRGYSGRYPENTLIAYRQALMAGARLVELDVQLSRDGVPVLYHDAFTQRISGVRGSLLALTRERIKRLSAHHPRRFGGRFHGNPVPTLAEFCALLKHWPATTAFVEIKERSLKTFGRRRTVSAVVAALRPIARRSVLISFDAQCVEYARHRYQLPIGWVLSQWDRDAETHARAMAPDYLFVDKTLLPSSQEMWRGPWKWAVYVVNDAPTASAMVARGIELLETDEIVPMLAELKLSPGVRKRGNRT